MKASIFSLLAGFFCSALLVSVLCMTAYLFPREIPFVPKNAPPRYLIKDEGGRVAVYAAFRPDAPPLARYDIYVNLLPAADVLRLKAGWPISNDAALQRTLEDLGY